MSTFNIAVPAHPLAPLLLRAINWAQPDDPEKKYPLLGRMRYVWMTNDYKQIKLMLRDSENSWSDEKDEIMAQIKGHETFVSVEVSEFDNTHIIATFNPIFETNYNRNKILEEIGLSNFEEFFELVQIGDEAAVKRGSVSVTEDPWVLFNKAMEALKEGKSNSRIDNLKKAMTQMFEQIDAEREIENTLKEMNIEKDPSAGPDIKIFTVGQDGNLKQHDNLDDLNLGKLNNGKQN